MSESIEKIVDLLEELIKEIVDDKISYAMHDSSDTWYSFPQTEGIKEKLVKALSKLEQGTTDVTSQVERNK